MCERKKGNVKGDRVKGRCEFGRLEKNEGIKIGVFRTVGKNGRGKNVGFRGWR